MMFMIGIMYNIMGNAQVIVPALINDVFVSNVTTTSVTAGGADPWSDAVTYNLVGIKIAEGNFNKGENISVRDLPIGVYVLKTADSKTYKFTKE